MKRYLLSKRLLKSTLIKIISILFLFSLTSCLNKHPEYHKDWPQIKKNADIEKEIIGEYSCYGHNVHSKMGLWEPSTLPSYLMDCKSPPRCYSLRINKLRENALELLFVEDDGNIILRKLIKKDKDYTVNKNWIVLNGNISSAAEDVVVAWSHSKPNLTIDEVGNLIVKSSVTTFGTIMVVIPVGSTGTDWGRFNRLDANEIK
ncbi:MAG: hypothetical protein ABFS32_20260 [Bacteroidota bacterium]